MFVDIRAKLTAAVEEAIATSVATAVQALTRMMDRRFRNRDEEWMGWQETQARKFSQLAKETNDRLQTLATIANKNTETTQACFIQCVKRLSRLEEIARTQSDGLAKAYALLSQADVAVAHELKMEIDAQAMAISELVTELAKSLRLEPKEGFDLNTDQPTITFVPVGTALEESAKDQLADGQKMIAEANDVLDEVATLRGESTKLRLPVAMGGKKSAKGKK